MSWSGAPRPCPPAIPIALPAFWPEAFGGTGWLVSAPHAPLHCRPRVWYCTPGATLLPRHRRVGFSESLVRKGLMFLQSTGDFEYRRERRLVHRMK